MKNVVHELIEEVEFKKYKFNIKLSYYYDEDLEEYYTDKDLLNLNLRKIRNEYRKIKGLLLDYEIKRTREKYDLSQKDFALLLGLGEVTITRYESVSVQDSAQDEIIRSAYDPEKFYQIALKNKEKYINEYNEGKFNLLLEKIKEQFYSNPIEIVYSKKNFANNLVGDNQLSLEKVYAVISRFCSSGIKLTKTKLAKLLWYTDFIFFKENKKSITGMSYCHLPYGAYPFMYDELLNDNKIELELILNDDFIETIIKGCKSNVMLNNDELEVINRVVDKFKNMNSKQVVEYMHNEFAYKDTKNLDYISYDYAKYIKL